MVDWGLGKRLSQESPPLDQPSHNGWGEDLSANEGDTRPDEAMGSPGYMSPEQAVGELDQIGSASDIFGLGAVLYCLLTGRLSFSGFRSGRRSFAVPEPGTLHRRAGSTGRFIPA